MSTHIGVHSLSDKDLGLVYVELASAYMRQNELNQAEMSLKVGENLSG